MKKTWFCVIVALLLCLITVGTTFAAESEGAFSYYDTAGLTYGSFSLPKTYDHHLFYGVVTDKNHATVATFETDSFAISFDEEGTSFALSSAERWVDGEYTFTLTIKNVQSNAETHHTFSFLYGLKRPKPVVSELPSGQGQYRLFFEDFLLSDASLLDVSMLDGKQKMVATTYLDFSSENLVGSMLTKSASGVEGYSFVEMVTLFQTAPIGTGTYQLYFNIDDKLISYQETCRFEVVDSPIIQSIAPVRSQELLYGENRLQPMIAGGSGFDVVVTGFQIDPNHITANLYDQSGSRVAKSVSCLYHDALVLGYGAINGYQNETGIQALALHMETSPSAVLREGETYRIVLSYEDSALYGKKEFYCVPETGLFVSFAEPFDIGAISLNVVNFSNSATYDIVLYDDAYGELFCGTTTIPTDGVLELNTGSPLTRGQGALIGSDGTQAQFFYKNELIGLFVPQEVHVNPVVLHPTTTEFVAHFTMTNYSIFENASVEVQLIKFAQRQGGGYVAVDIPYAVASSTEIQSIVRSKQDGYYNTDLLIEMSVTSALDENGLYSYLLNIDGHEIYLIDQGEVHIVQVVNNTVYQADILDRTLYGGIPVLQNELYFWCGGVVVRDPSQLDFYLVDETGQIIASMVPGSLTPLTMEMEQQFCGKLIVDLPMQVGSMYRLIAQYGGDILYTSSEYFGDDSANCAVLVQDDTAFFPGTNELSIFSQLANIPVDQISFEVVDFLKPYENIAVLGVQTEYNYDTYYQWKHSLILNTSLHEGIYKVVLTQRGQPLADAMICVSATGRIVDVQPDFDGDSIEGYWLVLENVESDASYGLLLGRSTVFSDAVIISEKIPINGMLYLSKAELIDLSVGNYEILLTKNNVPISAYNFYLSPFSTPLEIVDGNILSGELDKNDAAISLVFSQQLNINTVSTETVHLFDSDGVILPISVSVSADRHTLMVYPQALLREEAQYTLLLTTSFQSIYYGRMNDDIELNFFIRSGEQSKTEFFVSANQPFEIRDDALYCLSFLEGSFENDALLGVWADDISIDLSGYVGLLQCSPVIEITDYKNDSSFKRSASLALFNQQFFEGKNFVLLRYDPKTGHFEQEKESVFVEGVVHTPISGCGRYVLCLADAVPFKDVIDTWAEEYVEELWHYQIVSGYDSATFGPDLPITRSEFVKMLVSSLRLSLLNPNDYDLGLFRDFGQIEEWALPYWATAYQLNIIRGTSQNTISPNDYITRAEIVTMIGRAKSFSTTSKATFFTDASEIPVWASVYFAAAVESDILAGYADGSVRPNGYATRAETAKMISGLIRFD